MHQCTSEPVHRRIFRRFFFPSFHWHWQKTVKKNQSQHQTLYVMNRKIYNTFFVKVTSVIGYHSASCLPITRLVSASPPICIIYWPIYIPSFWKNEKIKYIRHMMQFSAFNFWSMVFFIIWLRIQNSSLVNNEVSDIWEQDGPINITMINLQVLVLWIFLSL